MMSSSHSVRLVTDSVKIALEDLRLINVHHAELPILELSSGMNVFAWINITTKDK
jgi:hypothetical protein